MFTPEGTQLLEVLGSQAAISLQNAALYTDLQRSEAFLAQGERVSQTGSFGWDAASGDLYWSQQLYSILEYEQRLLPASMDHALARVHVDDLEHVSRLLEDARRDRTEFETALRFSMPDGTIKHAQMIGRSILTGNPTFVGSVRDISENVHVEATLRQIQADLAHVSRVATLNAMSASIGHEVSQPLSGVVINAGVAARMLAANPPDIEGALQTVERTLRDAKRAAQVITRLRAMFAKKEPTLEFLDLNEATKDVIALSSAELERNTTRVRIELARDLPFVHADRVQLQQVILNLIINAADAMASITDRPRILTVSTGRDNDGMIRLSVRDSGVGIDLKVVDRLFQPFYTTKTNGLGVGLSICRSIIDAHHGRLWAEQNDGSGATFSFCLPPA
jgi:C4-dicarboxylate-specific signal transduction histidine kinase